MQSRYDINELYNEARTRWLKPAEVLYILRNHEQCQFTYEHLQKPHGGSLFLFNKRVLRFFRKDGHDWRKKKDGKTVGEAHERLKVGNVETLNCYYAHGEHNPNFQRRSYWMLDPAHEHIVLVHYRDIKEGKCSSGPVVQLSTGTFSSFSPISSSYTSQNPALMPTLNDLHEPYPSFQSPRSIEVASNTVSSNNGNLNNPDGTVGSGIPFDSEVSQALHDLEGQLSLDEESIQLEVAPFDEDYVLDQNKRDISEQENADFHGSYMHFQTYKGCTNSQDSLRTFQEVNTVNVPRYSSIIETQEAETDYYGMLLDQNHSDISLEGGSSLTIAQKQVFTIKEISPEWGYGTETTKVIIVGSFLCDSSESSWMCMFGDVEVPAGILQEGVLCCEAPPHSPGKVTLCITSGNRESCSEVREFEYRTKNSSSYSDSSPEEATRSPDELLLLVRFIRLLLSDSSKRNDNSGLDVPLIRGLKAEDESWSHVIDALRVGNGTSSVTRDWLLEQLLKDKSRHWLSHRSWVSEEQADCWLPKKEQGPIHMIAGLGFEWALNPILSCGVNINSRDVNGWTALHWAAHFGRERMVAALLASGASAGAVTDPSPQDPTGKTAASIAANSGHKGLAGYLSEVALTSHLASLTLAESELFKGPAEVEVESTINCISKKDLTADDDQLSLQHSLAAVRNAAQAAARIQSAFRAHSFRKRRQREAADAAAVFIQKKYRGWKGRKNFSTLREKVIKIQAHVRGYQLRKHYEVICWAVGILDKTVLRWRRRGVGLRGFRRDSDCGDEGDYEDILKVFRKQKVDLAVNEALSLVFSMIESPEARRQYQRVLEKYYQAKAELGGTSG